MKEIFSGFKRNSVYEGYVEEGRLLKGVNPYSTWLPNKRVIQTCEIGCTTHSILVMGRVVPRDWCFWRLNSKRLFSTSHPLCWVLWLKCWLWLMCMEVGMEMIPCGKAGWISGWLHTVKGCIYCSGQALWSSLTPHFSYLKPVAKDKSDMQPGLGSSPLGSPLGWVNKRVAVTSREPEVAVWMYLYGAEEWVMSSTLLLFCSLIGLVKCIS